MDPPRAVFGVLAPDDEHAEVSDCKQGSTNRRVRDWAAIDRGAFDEQAWRFRRAAQRSNLAPEPSAAERAVQIAHRLPFDKASPRRSRSHLPSARPRPTSRPRSRRCAGTPERRSCMSATSFRQQVSIEWRPILCRECQETASTSHFAKRNGNSRDRDVVRRDRRCRRQRGRRDPLERRRLAGRAARALRRRRARGRIAPPPRARHSGDRAGARRRRGRARRRRRGRRHGAARADRRAARRRLRGEGARVGASPAARPRRPPARPRRVALPASARSRAAVHLPARERRAHDAARRARTAARSACSGRPSTTPPARRSTRARGCSASVTRAGARSTRSRARAIRRAFDFPVARVPGLDFSFSGLKTALLYRVRGLAEGELEERRADLAASYQRAIVRALVERVRGRRSGADRRRRRGGGELGAPGGAAGGGPGAARRSARTTPR